MHPHRLVCLPPGPEALHSAEDEAQVRAYVALKGPVSVMVHADALFHYISGVITDCAGWGMNHAVVAVGYSDDYWAASVASGRIF